MGYDVMTVTTIFRELEFTVIFFQNPIKFNYRTEHLII